MKSDQYSWLDRRTEVVDLSSDITYTYFESSIGIISLVALDGTICALDINNEDFYAIRKKLAKLYPDATETEKHFRRTKLLLDRYLKGEPTIFDCDVDLTGQTPFIRRVLAELRKIPYGEHRSYLDIGKALGYPMAARAVGQAVGANPIPIIIPCHRVIRADGSLGGFSLGKKVKKRLLLLEGFKGIHD
jgi:methylated-DNA-[protein]-cysteine S-methyltransferase